MDRAEFIQWITDLDLQTLTDELKEEIVTSAEEAFMSEYDYGYQEGYTDAKDDIVSHIESEM
jgi:flagellar biosynthesis/type III secretory pathway protein FliH